MRASLTILASFLVGGLIGTANAQRGMDGASDQNIAKAEAEVASMQEPELRALLGYLSECIDRKSRSQVALQACRSARARYQTEYGGQRAVDAVIDSSEKYLEVRRLVDGGVPPITEEIDTKLRASVRNALQRIRHQ